MAAPAQNIGCLVMAAGSARRFAANKLAAKLGGKSLLRRTFEAVPPGLFRQVTVVSQYPMAQALAAEFGFAYVENPHPEFGVSHTILLGTQAMADCDAILYLVSDQPLLSAQSVAQVVRTWQAHPKRIVSAGHGGKRGNPCIFPREFFPELMGLQGDVGGSQVIRAHPERLLLTEIPLRELTDVDTPDALKALQ